MPDFHVREIDGRWIGSAQRTGRPAILIFFRGNGCPLRMAQVKELAGRYREIGALGVRVALISPQPHRNTIELARRFDVTFDFLRDKGNAVASILGIGGRRGLPAGVQVFGCDNYRVRPEPDACLDVLRSHGVGST